jgi:hypothetical protein
LNIQPIDWGFGVLWRLDGVAAAMLVSEALIASVCVYLAFHRGPSWPGEFGEGD